MFGNRALYLTDAPAVLLVHVGLAQARPNYIDAAEAKLVSVGLAQARPNNNEIHIWIPRTCAIKAIPLLVWLARPSHLTARGAKGKGRSSGSND